MRVVVTRDSVCLADDIDGLHRTEIDLPEGANAWEALEAIRQHDYLPRVAGVGHQWFLFNGERQIATVAGNWRELVSFDREHRVMPGACLHFRYQSARF